MITYVARVVLFSSLALGNAALILLPRLAGSVQLLVLAAVLGIDLVLIWLVNRLSVRLPSSDFEIRLRVWAPLGISAAVTASAILLVFVGAAGGSGRQTVLFLLLAFLAVWAVARTPKWAEDDESVSPSS
jgi:hypothetical protein